MSLFPAVVTGYRYRTRICNADPSYIPCLIGVSPVAPANPTLGAYFETVEGVFHVLKIGKVRVTKWVAEGTEGRNQIVECQYGKTSFYIPVHELIAEADKDPNGAALVARLVNLTEGASR
jgi:hypothetical protein